MQAQALPQTAVRSRWATGSLCQTRAPPPPRSVRLRVMQCTSAELGSPVPWRAARNTQNRSTPSAKQPWQQRAQLAAAWQCGHPAHCRARGAEIALILSHHTARSDAQVGKSNHGNEQRLVRRTCTIRHPSCEVPHISACATVLPASLCCSAHRMLGTSSLPLLTSCCHAYLAHSTHLSVSQHCRQDTECRAGTQTHQCVPLQQRARSC